MTIESGLLVSMAALVARAVATALVSTADDGIGIVKDDTMKGIDDDDVIEDDDDDGTVCDMWVLWDEDDDSVLLVDRLATLLVISSML